MNIHARDYLADTPLATTRNDLIKCLSTLNQCSVEGCSGKVRARGYCQMHWQRWRRHGNPTAGRAPNGEAERFVREVAAIYEGDDCLLWPYGRQKSGYGTAGKTYAHRLVCEIVHGPAPAGRNEAAHSCGNGHLGCVNPRHLRWASHTENMADMVAHGRSSRTVFTADEVLDIIESKGVLKRGDIAAKYGVHRDLITKIQQGKHPAAFAIIDEVADLYQNHDTIMKEQAIDAAASGRPVYWTTASYSSARASDLPYELNRGKPILEAIDAAYAGREFLRQQALDTIVPINRKAAMALANAYAKFGSWVDEDELLERRVRDVRRAA